MFSLYSRLLGIVYCSILYNCCIIVYPEWFRQYTTIHYIYRDCDRLWKFTLIIIDCWFTLIDCWMMKSFSCFCCTIILYINAHVHKKKHVHWRHTSLWLLGQPCLPYLFLYNILVSITKYVLCSTNFIPQLRTRIA